MTTFDTTRVEIAIWLTETNIVDTHIRVGSVSELQLLELLIRRGCFGLARKSAFGARLFHTAAGNHWSSYSLFTRVDGRTVLNPTLVADLRRLEAERRDRMRGRKGVR